MKKFRADFVTNSSSSSFVIALKPMADIDDETLQKYPFLKTYLETYKKLIEATLLADGSGDTTPGHVSKTKEEYDAYFCKQYGMKDETLKDMLDNDEYLAEIYGKATEYLDKEFQILDKQVDLYDDTCFKIIRSLATDKDNFIILDED